MGSFNFKTDFENLDGRSIFANKICKLIYDKNNCDLDESIKEAETYFFYLDEYVRNIYELVDSEIPLYSYYQLLKYGANNYGFNEDEYQEKLVITRDACKLYYDNK